MGVLVSVVVFVLGKLTGHIAKKAQQPVRQQELQPLAQHGQPIAPSAPPAVHVHVHLDPALISQTAAPKGTPTPAPSKPSGPPSPTSLLNRPDHRIYITTGSHLMLEHPACDELLERLDHMLYVAAHREGVPFTFGPPLDDTRPGHQVPLHLPPLAHDDEGEFFSWEGQPLPPPDGGLWIRKAGDVPHRLATGAPS